MKYVIFDTGAIESVRIFDDITNHSQVAREVNVKVISAGKLSVDCEGKPCCINGSVSLGLKFNLDRSNKDTELMRRFFEFTA